jgi:hypothetical protein
MFTFMTFLPDRFLRFVGFPHIRTLCAPCFGRGELFGTAMNSARHGLRMQHPRSRREPPRRRTALIALMLLALQGGTGVALADEACPPKMFRWEETYRGDSKGAVLRSSARADFSSGGDEVSAGEPTEEKHRR